MAYQDTQGYRDILNRIMAVNDPNNPYWTQQRTSGKLGGMDDQFTGMFRNMVGRDPTDQEQSAMFQNIGNSVFDSPSGYGGTSYADFQNLFNPYIQNTYGQEIKNNQQSAGESQLKSSENSVNDIVNQTMGNVGKQFSDPLSMLYQGFSGGMNNLGISPTSGAFQAGAGSTIASAGLDAANKGLSQVGFPQISNIAGTANAPYQNSLAQMYPGLQSYGGGQSDIYNFGLQSTLAQKLAEQSGPSGAQSALGMAGGAAQGAGSLMQGYGALSKGTSSYVCRELERRGLICASDLEDFYLHMFDAVWKKGRAFWHYKVNGQKLVDAVNAKGLDWAAFKPLLFDRVMEEPDPCKAVDLFSDACHQLCISAARDLWDERVMRTSTWDSLRFIPLLFTDPTFGKNFWNILRIKTLIVYDKPPCRLHR